MAVQLKDDKELFESFMTALQDPGVKKKTKKKDNSGQLKYPKIQKVALDLYKKLLTRHKHKFPAMDSNEN